MTHISVWIFIHANHSCKTAFYRYEYDILSDYVLNTIINFNCDKNGCGLIFFVESVIILMEVGLLSSYLCATDLD